MKYQKIPLCKFGIVLLLVLLVVVGCVEEVIDEGNNPTEPTGELPSDPGPGNLAGKVVGTIKGQPLAGLMVSARGRVTSTGLDGSFWLSGVGEGRFSVVISGNGIYTRTAAVNTASGRSVLLDAIDVNSNFHLGFYRELARGNHPQERNIFPTHRWTNPTPPTIYIDTNTVSTLDGFIDQSQKNAVRSVLSRVIPVFTGDFYPSVLIEERRFPDNLCNSLLDYCEFGVIPDNSFVVSFDDSLIDQDAYGLTITEPDFISPRTSTINKAVILLVDRSSFYEGITFEEVIAHETGHGFGFRHTSLLPSVMLPVGVYGGLYSESDLLHMRIVYRRPAGNTDIDNDPVPGAKMSGQSLGRQVHIDRRANFPKSPELLEQLQALPSRIPYEQLEEAVQYKRPNN